MWVLRDITTWIWIAKPEYLIWILIYWQNVTSCNTHITFADNIQLVTSHSNHPCHFHATSKILGTSLPCLNSEVINFRPWILPLVYVSFIVPLRPWLPVLPIHVYIALLCFHSHFQYPHSRLFHTSNILINPMFPNSVYKTLLHVIIQHVWISTWTLILLIVYLTSLTPSSDFRKPPGNNHCQSNSRSILSFTLDLYAHLFGLRSVPDNFRTPRSFPTHLEPFGTIGTNPKYSDMSSWY